MVRVIAAAASAILAFAGRAAAEAACTVSDTEFVGFTHYLVGQHRLPGSIYADCHDGTPTCYVDDGISDTADAEVDCGSVNVESRRRELGVFVSSDRAWPNRVVCYKWGAQFSDKAKGFWNTAFKTYQEKVDITWIESSKCRSTYGENTKVCNNCQTAINIQTSKAGCYAHLGYIPNKDYKPELNVGNGCEWLRIYTHEMGHSVGLIHEHSHPKREVIVLRNKLRVGSSNYVKDMNAPTSTYDRMSIMHYDGDEMCIPKDPKIKFCDVSETEANGCVVPKDEHCDRSKQDTFGRGETLTARDIEAINKLYEKEKRHEKSPGGGAPAPAPAPAPQPAPAPAPKPAPAPAPKPAPAPAPKPQPARKSIQQEMLDAVNAERAKKNLKPYCLNKKLQTAAQKHSEDQAKHKKLTHDGSDGVNFADRAKREGYNWQGLAENVAAGQQSVADVMKSWMDSPGHRANILGAHTHFGMGHAKGGNTPYWTQEFGSGRDEKCDGESRSLDFEDLVGEPVNATATEERYGYDFSDLN